MRTPFFLAIFIASLTISCQQDPTAVETGEASDPVAAPSHQQGGEPTVHKTEAVIGPDDAFFIQAFMESLRDLESTAGLAEASKHSEGASLGLSAQPFDYQANFSENRLGLAVDWIFYHGDRDEDSYLDADELEALRLEPGSLGNHGDSIALPTIESDWQDYAGSDDLVSRSELKSLLLGLGLLVKDPPTRGQLISKWLDYVESYDLDADGATDYEEQQQLKQDRKSQIETLRGKFSS
ncbi:MAG: hypothetical protein HRU19_17445 [Pseudobacteriovorax sp.]|nr:hypothetical protein [Pseudobacteriovorax sp.]